MSPVSTTKHPHNTHLLLGNGVLGQHEVCQSRKRPKGVQVRQLGQVVRQQNQVRQVRNSLGDRRLNGRDAVPRKKQGCYARRQGKVSQNLDIVVGEVDGIVRLRRSTRVSRQAKDGEISRVKLTPATPKFSMAGIRCPAHAAKRRLYQLGAPRDQKCSICSFQNAPRRSSSRSLRGLR